MSMRLNVVDGGDRGQAFRLPPAGTVRIGNYGGHTDIVCMISMWPRITAMWRSRPRAR